jgi:carboxylesterase type B
MVWIHGGQWVTGSGSHFDGTNLAGSQDVVVVSINYRLGVFGYLPTGPDGSGGMNVINAQIIH